MEEDNYSYSTDSDEARERDAKVEEVVEETDQEPVPEYTDDEVKQLTSYILQMSSPFELNEHDVTSTFNDVVKDWLLDVNEQILYVFYDGVLLSAAYRVPTTPVSGMHYFIREQGRIFTVENFHDEVQFGNMHENVEETLLVMLNHVYAPMILKDHRFDESVQATLFVGLHEFLAYLTDINSKIGSMVVLYVPNESHDMTAEEAVKNKPLVKRLESVVIYWISQIRLCLNDMENQVQNELACPSDEYDFWVYKHDVLSGIVGQIQHKNIQHIITILEQSQSLFIKNFKQLIEELNKELNKSSSNSAYLKLLVAPCLEIENLPLPVDVPVKLPNIIYLIRVISLNSTYYNSKANTERLFSHLSNEIINYCKTKVDINKILAGNPRFGIKICDMSIDCCLSYKQIFKELLDSFSVEDFKRSWMLDENTIFNHINIFIQRLYDVIEICETIIVFGRTDESMTIPELNFGCYNAHEFQAICKDIEHKFYKGLQNIKDASGQILNVYNRQWYKEISAFKLLIRSLEEVVENLFANVFFSLDNVEEALDALTALYNFSRRKNLQNEYLRRVNEMWKMFEDEIVDTNKGISRNGKERPSYMPKIAGKSCILNIRLKKLERLKEILTTSFYLPSVPAIEQVIKMYDTTYANITRKIDKYNDDWIESLMDKTASSYLNRSLICRSSTHAGLLECNIDRNILPIFNEIKYFEYLEKPAPSVLITMLPKIKKLVLIYNKVVTVVLLHNKIMNALSEKERLLFKVLITLMSRKIVPGIYKLTYENEVTDSYINDSLTHLDDLQHFVNIYKIINMALINSFECIANDRILKLKFRQVFELEEFKLVLKETRNETVKQIAGLYKKVIKYIIVVYDGFENYIGEMTERWMDYVRKFDALAEFAMLSCTKNTLYSVFYLLNGKNDLSPDPFLTLNVNLRERNIVFEPPLEEIMRSVKYIFTDIVKAVRMFPRLNEKFKLPASTEIKKFYEIVLEDRECRDINEMINCVIEMNIEKIRDYLDSWNLFRILWEVDINLFMTKYRKIGMELDDFEESMSKYFDVSNQVLMQDTVSTVTYVILNSSKLKKAVLEYVNWWKRSYRQTLCDSTLRKLEVFYTYANDHVERLSITPDNIEELEKMVEQIKSLTIDIEEKSLCMVEITSYYEFLLKYDIEIPTLIRNLYLDMKRHWQWYCGKLKEIDELLFNQKEQFKMGLLKDTKSLKVDAVAMLDSLPDECPTNSEGSSKQALQMLEELSKKLQNMIDREKVINQNVDFHDLYPISNPELSIIQKELDILKEIWTLVGEWEVMWDTYQNGEFSEIDINEMEESVVSLYRRINKLYGLHKEKGWDVLKTNKIKVEQFKKTMPLISYLKNPAMKERHWDQVKSTVKQNFDQTLKSFDLNSIMVMNFQAYSDEIQDISDSATMELQIENNINNIILVWSTLKFEIVQHKEDFLKIQGVDDCFQALEEHTVMISNMKSTRFVEPFEELVNCWETKLSSVTEVLEGILQVQKKWLYLENIFQGDDIRKQMRDKVKEFDKATNTFQSILLEMSACVTAVEATSFKSSTDLLIDIHSLIESFETIQRALEAFLETKRNIFPRFYFLSNDDLLEILGNSKKPDLIQIHFKKLFDGLHKWDLKNVQLNQTVSKWYAAGMISGDELVSFSKPLIIEGPVEQYLNDLELKMRVTLKELLRKTRANLKIMSNKKEKWLETHPGQLCIVASLLRFTTDCVDNLNRCQEMNERTPLKFIKKKQKKLLSKLSEISRKELDGLMRAKISSLITTELHSRDIIDRMLKSNCMDTSHFDWFSQLKFYWDLGIDDCIIKQTNTNFVYQYEYSGNPLRLAITPLTDRSFITITTALHMFRGGSLAGPAGTGKTETVKDLSKALGLWAIVTNCSEGLDYKSIGKSFIGLAQTGCWGCFDEFNRIDIEVLSVVAQQILCILTALSMKKKNVLFEGQDVKLVGTVGLFITMNPGYAGRTELPDNLKSMFRPMSMMLPDDLIIAENNLFSNGFIHASSLAKKVVTLYNLSKLQLSKQCHYDFGLRSMVALLKYGGRKKRENPEISEEEIIYLAMSDMNLAKLTYDDMPLFLSIMQDIFPSVTAPSIKYDHFIDAIKEEFKNLRLQSIPIAIQKVIQLHETKCSRHSVMIVGQTNTAKSVTWKVLKKSYNNMKSKNVPGFEHVTEYLISPKAVSSAELYGEYNLSTGEWNDGILCSIMRKVCADESPGLKWILFDGPVDAVWIENMNSLMDENKLLTLINSERITMPDQVSLIFEVGDLSIASPATISRCGMIYNDYKDFGWRPFIASWLDRKQLKIQQLLQALLDRSLDQIFEFKRTNCLEIIPSNELNLVMSFCKLWDSLATSENGVDIYADNLETIVRMWFFFCIVWSVCAVVKSKARNKMDYFVRELDNIFPVKDTIYDYYVDGKQGLMKEWSEHLDENWRHPDGMSFFKIVVPTVDTIRYGYLLSTFLKNKHTALLVGEVGTGKSSMVMSTLSEMDSSQSSSLIINMSAQTTSQSLLTIIESRFEKQTKTTFVPIGGKSLVTFIDDFNMPFKDKYGTQSSLELLRQWMDYGFWYNTQNQSPKFIKKMLLLAAMGPVGGGRQAICPRTASKFCILNVAEPSEKTTNQMFCKILTQHFESFPQEIISMAKNLTKATTNLYNHVVKKMLPTPAKIHYLFNLRDVSKVFQGLLRSSNKYHDYKGMMLRLWVHECQRVFCDRFIDDDDNQWFTNKINHFLGEFFETTYNAVCPNKDPLFGHFMNPLEVYEDLTDQQAIQESMIRQLEDYNSTANVVKMDLIFFKDAIKHIIRIIRVISQSKGHMLVVGIAGSGRQSLCKLAAFISELAMFQIKPNEKYKVIDFKEDLKVIYKNAGLKKKPSVLLLNDTQLKDELFFEILNNLLSTGEVSNLFKADELEEFKQELKKDPEHKSVQTNEETYAILVERAQTNLHIILCLSPIGEDFRTRVRQYPALINCTTIDWFCEWPEEAFLEVSNKYFNNLCFNVTIQEEEPKNPVLSEKPEVIEEKLRQKVSSLVSFIHLSVCGKSREMSVSAKRFTYITPSSFLEMVIGFDKMLIEKREQITFEVEKFRNGLSKIEEASEKVAVLSVELVQNQEKIVTSTNECDTFMSSINKQTQIADEEQKTVNIQREIISEEASKVGVLREQAVIDLEKAMPALNDAIAALNSLNKKDLTEMKTYVTPPTKVEKVLEAVMILLSKPTNWAESKKQLGDPHFLENLLDFDKNNISEQTLKKIGKYTANPDLQPDKVAIVSNAAKSLIIWVRAIEQYGIVWRYVGPKQQHLAQLEQDLASNLKSLSQSEQRILELAIKLKELNNNLQEKLIEKNRLAAAADLLKKKLERARTLVESLASERARWIETEKQLVINYGFLLGDCLVSTAFLCYLGPFTSNLRDELLKVWYDEIILKEIPITTNILVKEFLTVPTIIREWNISGLPADNFSTENGILVTKASRWPIMIDPQNQAYNWIRSLVGDSLKMTDLTATNFVRVVERAIRAGDSLLIQNIGEEIPTILMPVLTKSLIHQGGNIMIDFNDKLIDYNPKFQLYFTTRLPNPHYQPEVFTKTKVVNFSVKEEGLEEQLLSVLVRIEKPSLEEQKDNLVVGIAKSKKMLVELEDKILRMLNENFRGPVLEDDELFATLESSKETSKHVKIDLMEAESTESNIDLLRIGYLPIATRASILFFVLRDLSNIDSMYQFSLAFYIRLFVQSIERSQDNPELEERIKLLNDYHTLSVYRNTCLGLFEKHKLLFSFYMAVKIMERNGDVNQEQYDFLLKGGIVLDREKQPNNPDKSWITEEAWDNITELDKLGGFMGITDSFFKDKVFWRDWFSQSEPESTILPADWSTILNPFQRILLVRSLRLDRISVCLRSFVLSNLGQKFLEPPVLDLTEIFKQSQKEIPLIFVLSAGVDPTSGLKQLAEASGITSKFKSLSLGQGQSEIACKLIQRGMSSGHWVFLANCHLSLSWMPELEKLVETLQFKDVHNNFRLWLSSSPHKDFPISILQASRKLTTEPPRGIKANLKRLYNLITEDKFQVCQSQEKYRNLLFSLAFFHSVLLERRKFEQLGWNIVYSFNDSDFDISENILALYLDEYEETPWDALKFMISDINYGGHITDSMDKKLIKTYSFDMFNERVLNTTNYQLTESPLYSIPSPGTLKSYHDFIGNLPSEDAPEVFGQHQNANITSSIMESKNDFSNLLLLQSNSSAGANEDQEEKVYQLAVDILNSKPQMIDYESTKKLMGRNLSPLDIVLLQEIERYNRLLSLIEKDLSMLLKCIRGLAVLTSNIEIVFNALENGVVPSLWLTIYPSLKPLGSWTRDLVLRVEHFKDWAKSARPPKIFWLSAFSLSTAFLTAVLQRSARSQNISIDALNWEFVVLNAGDLPQKDKFSEGVYIGGIFLEGGSWDVKGNCLKEPNLLELICPMPVIFFKATTEVKKKSKRIYECPTYYYPIRATIGQVQSYIISVDLRTGKEKSNYWIKRGTALLLSLTS